MSRLAQTMAKSDARRRRQSLPPFELWLIELEPEASGPILSDDVRLFALTFLGGFLFMTVYLA